MQRPTGFPPSSATFDWFMGVLAALVVTGIFQDGWAHNHGLVDQSFFTPWHAVLYGTMALNGLLLLCYGLLNMRRGYTFRNGLPYGYWLSAIGVAVFLFGGVLDMAWHTLFGIEENINALVSPTHLLLALGGAFVVSGPLRSVARRVAPDAPARWRETGPAVLAAASMLSLMAFFTQYANPIGDPSATSVIGKSDRAASVSNLYVMHADGSQQTRLIASSNDQFGAAASPDGKRIVFRTALSGTVAELFTANADGSGSRQITHDGRWASQPACSPDGKRIAYVSIPAGTSGTYRLMTIAPDGTQARTLVDTVAEINGPAWSADGTRIAYGTRNGTGTQLALVSASGGKPEFLNGSAGGSFPAYASDGKRMAYQTPRGVLLANADGTNAHLLVVGAMLPAFSPRGDRVAYVSTAHGTSDVGVINMRGGPPSNLTHLSGMNASRPSFTPDGRILYTAGANAPVLSTEIAQAFSIDAFLISSVLVMGALLILVRRFNLPAGSITLFMLIYTIEQATQADHYFAILPALITAILADCTLIVWRNRMREGAPFYAFAFSVSALLCGSFIAAVNIATGGLGWPPNIIFGTPVLAGIAGLLIAFCCAIPLPQPSTKSLTSVPLDFVDDLRTGVAAAHQA